MVILLATCGSKILLLMLVRVGTGKSRKLLMVRTGTDDSRKLLMLVRADKGDNRKLAVAEGRHRYS